MADDQEEQAQEAEASPEAMMDAAAARLREEMDTVIASLRRQIANPGTPPPGGADEARPDPAPPDQVPPSGGAELVGEVLPGEVLPGGGAAESGPPGGGTADEGTPGGAAPDAGTPD